MQPKWYSVNEASALKAAHCAKSNFPMAANGCLGGRYPWNKGMPMLPSSQKYSEINQVFGYQHVNPKDWAGIREMMCKVHGLDSRQSQPFQTAVVLSQQQSLIIWISLYVLELRILSGSSLETGICKLGKILQQIIWEGFSEIQQQVKEGILAGDI